MDTGTLTFAWHETHEHEAQAAVADVLEHAPAAAGVLARLRDGAVDTASAAELLGELLGTRFLAQLESGATRTRTMGSELVSVEHTNSGPVPPPTRPPGPELRFSLDANRATRWLAAAAATDADPAGGGGAELPAIGPAWDPYTGAGGAEASALVYLARVAGIITAPAGMDVNLDYADDEDGGCYRVVVTLTSAAPRLATPSREWRHAAAGPGVRGAAAALAILGDVTIAANELLGGLANWAQAAPGGPAAAAGRLPAAVAEVWVLRHDDPHSDTVSVHATREHALADLAFTVRSRWDNITGSSGVPATPNGLDDQEAVDLYFARRAGIESYTLYSEELGGAVPPLPYGLSVQAVCDLITLAALAAGEHERRADTGSTAYLRALSELSQGWADGQDAHRLALSVLPAVHGGG